MSHNTVNSGINHRLMSLFLMLHHRRGEGVLLEDQGNYPPTRNNKDQPQRRNERAGFAHQMKPEYVQVNEHDHSQESCDKQKRDYLIRQRLSLLHGWFEAFVEQILSAWEDDGQCRGSAHQDQSEEYPGAGPIESARRQEKQRAEEDEIVDDAENR